MGDALGAPVECLRYAEIGQRFGPRGITHYAPAYGRLGAITDDTQMTLFTAEGLIRARVWRQDPGSERVAERVGAAYGRWWETQTGRPLRPERGRDLTDWLISHRALHARRGPGKTCLSAISAMTVRGCSARNDSKGCGGVMRIAPVGLIAGCEGRAAQETMAMGRALAALTHGHPTGSIAAGALAVWIAEIVQGRGLAAGLATVSACLAREPQGRATQEALAHAEALARDDPADPVQAIHELGRGAVAEEALAIALYCALTARDFADGVIRAVNHDGDSDSTGSITGAVLGALWGDEAIPARYRDPLELHDVISEMAEDLAAVCAWPVIDDGKASRTERQFAERMRRKYPGC